MMTSIRRSFGFLLGITLVFSLSGLVLAQENHAGEHQQQRRMPGNPNSGFLGVKLGPIDDEAQERLKLDGQDGILVMELIPGSPAEKAGLKVDDVVKKIDGDAIADVESFVKKMWTTKPDQQVKFTVIREGKEQEVNVTLGKRPADLQQVQEDEDKDKDKAHGDEHDKSPSTQPGR